MNVEIEEIISHIEPLDTSIMAECHKRLLDLPEPVDPNLAFLAERIAGVRRTVRPEALKKAVVIFAADHAVDGGGKHDKGQK
jgi:nicotinate-nucleotide--dimethylbenzimidazole phosphoribosyltransferase